MSEDPYLTGAIATAQVRGVQSNGRSHATIKHFAANESEFQRERWTAASRVPSRAMHELYLLPFEMAVKDGRAASVMCAFPHLNGAWACESSPLLRQTLRERWGFDGYVVSDRRALRSTVPSILAGTDYELDFAPEWFTPERVRAAIDAGEISEADIDRMLRPRYTKMFEFGHFDEAYDDFLPTDFAEHDQVARRAAEESIVLLKNIDGTLPLRAGNTRSVALIGHDWFAGRASLAPRNSDPETITNVVAPFTVTPRQGLENTLAQLGQEDASVTYEEGDVIDAAASLASRSDVAIVMVGDNPRETVDKTTVSLPRLGDVDQEALVPAILDANPNTIVVLKTEGMVLMPWLDRARAVVEAWYPGQQDGNVVADMLFGVTSPSGKLPVTFGTSDREAAFATEAQYPGLREDNGLPGGPGWDGDGSPQLVAHYTENLQLGYRWYEANQVRPVFPFGHGLSYTTFESSDLVLRPFVNGRGNTVVGVEFKITNTGRRTAREAAQVYVTLPPSADEPSKRLVGFEKVRVPAGQTRRVTVALDAAASNHPFSYFAPDDPADLTRWADGEWVTPDGTYTVHVGTSSARTPLQGTFDLAAGAPAGPPVVSPTPAPPSGGPTPPSTPPTRVRRPSARRGKVAISGKRLRVKRVVRVKVRCPAALGDRGCVGRLTATRGKVRGRARVLGRARVSIDAGRTGTVRLVLKRRVYRTLVRRHALSMRLGVRVRGDDGTQRTSRWVWVVAPRRT